MTIAHIFAAYGAICLAWQVKRFVQNRLTDARMARAMAERYKLATAVRREQ